MKHIFAFISAIFTFLIIGAYPIIVHADNNYNTIDLGNGSFPYEHFDSPDAINTRYSSVYPNTYNQFLYLNFLSSYVNGGKPTGGCIMIYWNDNCDVTFENSIISISTNNSNNMYYVYDMSPGIATGYGFYRDRQRSNISSFTFNIVSHECIVNGTDMVYKFNMDYHNSNHGDTLTYYDCYTNCTDFSVANEPNISFEFSPSMSGTVSRKQTINGESFTSDSLNMYVSNSGSDGQFAMFIVPSGGSVTFPVDLTENNAGFTSSPLYAYIADEWITCTVNGLIPSMLANMSQLYAPCAWHTILGGTVDQCYYIPWEHMNLQANTTYDIVCYGAPNGDTASTNTAYEANAGALYSVTSDLSDVTEIYRSTFTITDPAVYNPDSANGFSHPYDGTQDMSSLFNVSNIAKDENGNLIIRGQNTGSFSNINYNVTGAKVNPSQAFGQFFPFFTTVLGYFPSQWVLLITIGISCIVVIGIIKAVTH